MYNFGKGMFLGLAAGIGLSLMANPMSKRDIRTMKRRMRRALYTVGDAAEGICCKMK